MPAEAANANDAVDVHRFDVVVGTDRVAVLFELGPLEHDARLSTLTVTFMVHRGNGPGLSKGGTDLIFPDGFKGLYITGSASVCPEDFGELGEDDQLAAVMSGQVTGVDGNFFFQKQFSLHD